MKAPDFKKIAVIGSGRMGPGIAQLAAMAGCSVALIGRRSESLRKAEKKIAWSLEKLAEKNCFPKDAVEETLSRISYLTEFGRAVRESDLIIEAITEDTDTKLRIFHEIDKKAPPHAILSSTTSTIPITELASATRRPGKVVGIHFFNPPQLIKLVEVIPGKEASEETIRAALDFAKFLGKEALICRKDVPAFTVNRILLPILDEAAWTVVRGESSILEIDYAFRTELRLPMGPFELMDFVGIDVVYCAMREVVRRDRGLILFSPLIKKFYEQHFWGRDRGGGFHDHLDLVEQHSVSREVEVSVASILAPAANSIAKLLRAGMASIEEVNKATKLALGFPEGIVTELRSIGLDKIYESLVYKWKAYGCELYRPDEGLKSLFKAAEAKR